MMTLKRIIKYLEDTKYYGLYNKRSDIFELKDFTHSNCAENNDDKRSTSGGAFFLGNRLVSWTRKKQKCFQSIVEAKYMVATMNFSYMM